MDIRRGHLWNLFDKKAGSQGGHTYILQPLPGEYVRTHLGQLAQVGNN